MSKKFGLGRTPPQSEARPLGTSRPKPVKTADQENKKSKKGVDKKAAVVVSPAVRAVAGSIREERSDATQAEEISASEEISTREEISTQTQEVVDIGRQPVIESSQSPITASDTSEAAGRKKMTLTFKGLSKNGKNAFYTGAATVQRFALNSFVNKSAPASFDVDDVFAGPKAPKAKLTKEERAALPKPAKKTLAEQIAAREANLEKLRAKAAAEASAQASM